MPCFYTGSAEGDAKLQADDARKALTITTEMLCTVCALIDDHNTCHDANDFARLDLPKDVKKWWKKHKKIDKIK